MNRETRIENVNKKPLERFNMIMGTLLMGNYIYYFLKIRPQSWAVVFITVITAACWCLFFSRVRSYEFRVKLQVIGMQLGLCTYASYCGTIQDVALLFSVLILITGLYGIINLMCIGIISNVFILLFDICVMNYLSLRDILFDWQNLMSVLCMLMSQIIVFIWVKNRDMATLRYETALAKLKETEKNSDMVMMNVSHAIRTPVNIISGFSDMLLQKELQEDIEDGVLAIQNAGQTLGNIVSDIFDYSELHADRIAIEEEVYSITDTISEIIEFMEIYNKEKQLEFIVDCDADVPKQLMGDEKKIRRVIMNLLTNAVKFTNEGYIKLSVHCRRESYGVNLTFIVTDTGVGMSEKKVGQLFTEYNRFTPDSAAAGGLGIGLRISRKLVQVMNGFLTVKTEPEKGSEFKFVIPQKVVDEKCIAVVDNPSSIKVVIYINMEKYRLTAVRDEYMSLMDSMARQLNLKYHICKNLAEFKRRSSEAGITHAIIAELEYDEDSKYCNELATKIDVIMIVSRRRNDISSNIKCIGKVFCISEVAEVMNTPRYQKNKVYTENFMAPDVHILMVDDNVINIKIMEGLMKRYEIKVTGAISGEEALKKIEEYEYDFILMDYMMPDMDGIETLKRIRQKQGFYYKNVPVIAFTAYAMAGSREFLMEEGFIDFLEKPVERQALERLIIRNVQAAKIVRETHMVSSNYVNGENEGQAVDEEVLLDQQTGIMYCGNRESYLEVLKDCVFEAGENMRTINVLFDDCDWEHYVIKVHALKSLMATIGATELSEVAKQLELAGKQLNIEYIEANHKRMMEMYDKVSAKIAGIVKSECSDKDQLHTGGMSAEEIEDKKFDIYVQEMEEAMFNFDKNTMLNIVGKLENASYKGRLLKSDMESVRRKVEQSDYMPAVDLLRRIKVG